MEISIHRNDDRAVIDLSGRVAYGQPVGDLYLTIKELVDLGVIRIVLDLHEVSYLDSVGVGALMTAYTTCAKNGGDLRLINVHGKAKKVLHITKLESLFGLPAN